MYREIYIPQKVMEYRKCRDTLIADCKRLRGEGKSYRQIGDALGISHTSVGRYLEREINNEGKDLRMIVPVLEN
jgi:DNA invertase Pin-like site-specific DNA recombinase